MSVISYEQRKRKIQEKDSKSSLLLIYEWVKTGQISFDVFESLLKVREDMIRDSVRYSTPS